MDKRKIAKRPRKADAQYTQELLVKSVVNNIRLARGAGVNDVNRCTTLAAEFIVTIHDIYCDYSNYLEKKELTGALKLDRRKHLEDECLKKAGKNVELNKDSDLAQLGIPQNMISSGHLMHEERRASINALCHVFVALDWLQSGTPPADAETKAQLRKAAVHDPRKRFASYTPQNDAEPSSLIRAAAKPFGYWLPEKKDDEARDALIQSVIRDGTALMQFKAPPSEEDYPAGDSSADDPSGNTSPKEKLDYPLDLPRYMWLTPQKLDTLYDPQGAWSHDANKLHMIIAACQKHYSAQEIEQVYHAFGLHPQGLSDPKNGNLPLYKRPDYPVDQAVLVSTIYFRDLIQCVKCDDFTTRMSAFWGILFAMLNDYDEGTFRETKLGLRDQLFFSEKKPGGVYDPKSTSQKRFYNPLYSFEDIFEKVDFLPNQS